MVKWQNRSVQVFLHNRGGGHYNGIMQDGLGESSLKWETLGKVCTYAIFQTLIKSFHATISLRMVEGGAYMGYAPGNQVR